ncbi:hypothetical protein BDZ91DRAFT_709796 [Kalaharituber pfeilii]|nr:hypothetical protein BDZ91DRAFT_709796 [Kalaharituber pfeilii]
MRVDIRRIQSSVRTEANQDQSDTKKPEPVSYLEAGNALPIIKNCVQQIAGTPVSKDEEAAFALQRLEKYLNLQSLKRL